MSDFNTTPSADILESLRAISVAATERHAALKDELTALEQAFPALCPVQCETAPRARKKGTGSWQTTPEARAAQSARMRKYWAAIRAAEPSIQ